MRAFLILAIGLLSLHLSAQQKDTRELFFDPNSHELSKLSMLTIDKLLEGIEPENVLTIRLSGFTDSDGDAAHNKILAEKRIEAVEKYLFEKGYSNLPIQENPYGEQLSASGELSEQTKQHDRRVEVEINYTKRDAPIAKVEQFRTNRKFIQTFKVNADKAIVVTGKKGCKVYFSDSAFVDRNGNPVRGEITVELIEATTISEMIGNGLQTVYHNELIESAGMVYINIYIAGSKLSLKPGKPAKLELPVTNRIKDAKRFYGDTSGSQVKWYLSDADYIEGLNKANNDPTIKKYTMVIGETGWINCDRFLGKVETTDLEVMFPKTNVKYVMVFKSIKSLMNGLWVGERLGFSGVPTGNQVEIIAFGSDNGQLVFGSRSIQIEANMKTDVPLQPISSMDLENRLAQLNR